MIAKDPPTSCKVRKELKKYKKKGHKLQKDEKSESLKMISKLFQKHLTITDGPSGAKVPKSEIGVETEISQKINKKMEFE